MAGKPAKMGAAREENHDHWFGGGFAEFVEGAAKVRIEPAEKEASAGEDIHFKIVVHSLATGHKFPTGSVEERDVWLHVTLVDKEFKEIAHKEEGNISTIDFSFPASEEKEQKFKWSLLNLDGILEIKID